jgi:hypothetical protein
VPQLDRLNLAPPRNGCRRRAILGALLKHLAGKRDAEVTGRRQMSPVRRRFVEDGAQGRRADLNAEEPLGGVDPERLLGAEGATRV